MICRNRTGFKNSHLSVFMPIRRKNIIHFSTHFLVIVCFVFERREFFHPERRNIERFHQFKCLFIKAVRFFISTEKYIQNCFAIFMGNCEISSVIWIANDLSVPVIPIYSCTCIIDLLVSCGIKPDRKISDFSSWKRSLYSVRIREIVALERVLKLNLISQLQYFTNWIRKSSSFIPISKY